MTEPSGTDYNDSLDVAIVGMAGRFPNARDLDEYWRNLHDGRCAVTRFDIAELRARGVSPTLLDHPNYVPAGYLLEGYDMFDADFFAYSPREAELMDPQHRLLLECGWTALEKAGYDPERYDGLIGVYAGASNNTYLMFNVARREDIVDAVGGNQVMLGNSGDFLASRLSYKLGLDGPSLTVQTACSTSLVAVGLACQGLLAYQCDMALAGGVTADLLKHDGYLYEPDGLLSPDGLCRSFDAEAKGTAAGNGVGLVVLKRLADAVIDGDHIHAVIKGSAINNDGARRAGYTAPSAESQAVAITSALANGEVAPETVGYVEAHGTATILGDPIEFSALRSAFGGKASRRSIALGSVKTNVGHLDAAAGVAGLIKTTLTVERGVIPPTLHFTSPNSRIDLDSSPFFVNTEPIDWPRSDGPRRAGVSSFGLGGTNAHVVLEQAPALPEPAASASTHLVVLSARTAPALDVATERLADHLRDRLSARMGDVAATLSLGRKAFSHRRVFVCSDATSALDALDNPDGGRLLSGTAAAVGRRPVAFMFTGFGDHYPGMAARLYDTEPVFRAAVDGCLDILQSKLHTDLRPLIFERRAPRTGAAAGGIDLRRMLLHEEREPHQLDRPLYGHPALFSIEYALAQLWQSWGVRPAAMIGHSLGEYVAACLAGVFSLPDALHLVVARARLIEQQGQGAMLAVARSQDAVHPLLGDGVTVAAVNGPRNCVVAGPVDAVESFAERLEAEGIASRRLPGQSAAHSTQMDPVVAPYAEIVRGIRLSAPTTKFISNISGTWITAAEATDAGYWARHVREPVRFADGVQILWSLPGVMLVEVGPGQTLCSAALQQAPRADAQDRIVAPSMSDACDGSDDRAVMLRTLGRLWMAGAPVDWTALHPAGSWRRTALPTYPFDRRRFWLEPAASARALDGVRRSAVDEWFYSASWQRLDRPAAQSADVEGQSWLVFGGAGDPGAAVADALRRRGAVVTVVAPGAEWAADDAYDIRIDPTSPADYTRLADMLRARNQVPVSVVHCWNASPCGAGGATSQDLDRALTLGFHSLVRWAQASEVDLAASEMRWGVVTAGAYSVHGDEPVHPIRSAMQGVCKVAPQEYPSLTVNQIDLHGRIPDRLDTASVDQLLAELLGPGTDAVVALRGAHRWGPTYVPMSAAAGQAPSLRKEGVYLITGGLGRIGLVLAASLAESHRARLVLVGRNGLPDRDAWDDPALDDPTRALINRLREIEAAGAELLLCAADVSDASQMAEVIAQARARFGRIDGVLHAAGITGDRAHHVLADVGQEDADLHFRSKVYGTCVLDSLFADEELDIALLFSSLSPLLGGLGFTAYASANAFLDAFAQRAGSKWTSVNWEGWRLEAADTGAPGMGALVNEFAITPQEGRAAFDHLVTVLRAPQIVVSTADVGHRAELWRGSADPGRTASRHARPTLRSAYVPPATDMEARIAAVWQDLLGVEEVGVHDNFFELGGTSLLGVQVVRRLRSALNQPVPLTVVYEGPTIRALADLLSESEDEA